MPARTIRVLTWNIQEGGCDNRLEGILRLAKSMRPDVVAFQECNGWHARGETTLRRVTRALRMDAFPYWNISGYQPVILSRVEGTRAIPHENQEQYSLGYQEVILPLPGGRTWRFFNAHLNPFGEETRLAEIRTIARAMNRHRAGFCSLTGDMNSVAPGDLYFDMKLRPRMVIKLNENPLLRCQFDFASIGGLTGYSTPKNPMAWRQLPFRLRRLVEKAEIRTDVYLHMKRNGWVDGFRKLHPRERGHSFMSNLPYARIDYVWLSRPLAPRLRRCDVLYGRPFAKASDHCPLLWEIDVD
jgi:endonuclease/exonuclease/phosphatase family metal-dependent hydrolase